MEQNWQRTMNMTAASARPLAMNESFAVGDVIDHPKFGSGVVQEIFPPDKMQIPLPRRRQDAALCVLRGSKRDFEIGRGTPRFSSSPKTAGRLAPTPPSSPKTFIFIESLFRIFL